MPEPRRTMPGTTASVPATGPKKLVLAPSSVPNAGSPTAGKAGVSVLPLPFKSPTSTPMSELLTFPSPFAGHKDHSTKTRVL